jgi:hypothetical protein
MKITILVKIALLFVAFCNLKAEDNILNADIKYFDVNPYNSFIKSCPIAEINDTLRLRHPKSDTLDLKIEISTPSKSQIISDTFHLVYPLNEIGTYTFKYTYTDKVLKTDTTIYDTLYVAKDIHLGATYRNDFTSCNAPEIYNIHIKTLLPKFSLARILVYFKYSKGKLYGPIVYNFVVLKNDTVFKEIVKISLPFSKKGETHITDLYSILHTSNNISCFNNNDKFQSSTYSIRDIAPEDSLVVFPIVKSSLVEAKLQIPNDTINYDVTYMWYKDGTFIDSTKTPFYEPKASGNYSVVVELFNNQIHFFRDEITDKRIPCKMSKVANFNFTYTGIEENQAKLFWINDKTITTNTHFALIDMLGRVVKVGNEFNFQDFQCGIYFLNYNGFTYKVLYDGNLVLIGD